MPADSGLWHVAALAHSMMPALTCRLSTTQAGTHVTLWLRSWHTHTRVQYALSFLLLAGLAAATEALSALRAK